jgi:hypothetical protein
VDVQLSSAEGCQVSYPSGDREFCGPESFLRMTVFLGWFVCVVECKTGGSL